MKGGGGEGDMADGMKWGVGGGRRSLARLEF